VPSPDTETIHWPPAGHGTWTRWRGYLARWVAFGVVVNIFQPGADGADALWLQKTYQALWGLWFGVVCAVVFTWAENTFNAPRTRWKTWALVIATWLVVKVVFVSTLAAMGPAT
jgi:hypothetical protein